jgi:4-diphosphocytidyl-2-C-methyl-D-erythritol kinase
LTGEIPPTLRLPAPAKVNLYLHITGRRPGGYHLLDSLIVFTALSDDLELEPSHDMSLSVEGAFSDGAGPPDDNLVLQAARALADAASIGEGMAARLVKNIPAAAGLGGGSSDAAAALRGLMQMWDIPREAVDLPALALELGADIPVCLTGHSSFIGGIGEEIAPAPMLPDAGILLVNPGVALSTPSVFAGRRGGFSPPGRFSEAPASVEAFAGLLSERDNDLTDSAIGLAPVIADVLAALESAPGCRLARMTGSGATCFGLFDDEAAAEGAAGALRRDDWWVQATRIV